MIKYLRYAGLAVVFVWFFGGGVTHFTNTDFFCRYCSALVALATVRCLRQRRI